MVSTTLPGGGETRYAYDATTNPWANNVASVTRVPNTPGPANLVTAYTYDPTFNKPLTVTDPLGRLTIMAYDSATGNLLSMVVDATPPGDPNPHFNATTRYTYNATGQLRTITDPLGVITRHVYDDFGNRTATTGAVNILNRTMSWTYDSVGNITAVTDPNGNVTRSTWDANRRVLTTTTPTTSAAPAGLVITNTWDAAGRLLQVRQSSQGTALRTTSATYSPTGKALTATDANSNVTRSDYDLLDRRTTVTDPMGRTTRFTYTPLSQPYQTFNTAIQAAPLLSQSLNSDGLRASLTDANNNTTLFAYDAFDRLATTTYPGSPATAETLAYDADGNVTSRCTRAKQPIGYAYDTLNRLSTKTLPGAATACTDTPSGTVVTYGWDLAGRQTSVGDNSASLQPIAASPINYATSYTYDARNQPTAVSFSPVSAATTPSAGSAVTFTHGYNAANQRSSQRVDTVSPDTPANWIAYPPATASTTGYAANSLNQYTCVGVTSPSCAGVVPTYDNNGNLTSDGTYAFGYDSENRLNSATAASLTASYTFDARGRRKTKTVNGTTTIFVTDADNREVLEYDGSTGAALRWYTYALGPNAVLGQMNISASIRSTPVPDALGSFVGSMDANSGTLTSFAYRPYGSAASTPSAFAFTGQRIDPELGNLYYYRARHYSSALGRFLQADPNGYMAGINLYAYTGNNPLNLVDPSGLDAYVLVNGNNVQIILPINFTGRAANPTTVQAVSAAVGAQWSGTFGKYQVTTEVTSVSWYDTARNNIELASGAGTSFVSNGSSGTWYQPGQGNPTWESTHEAGHLMGLGDQYAESIQNGVRVTGPLPGFATNIMGAYGQTGVTEQDIMNIINGSANRSQPPGSEVLQNLQSPAANNSGTGANAKP